MIMPKYKYKAMSHLNSYGEKEWWVVGYNDESEIRVTKIAHWITNPLTVAEFIARSMNQNKKE